MPVLQADIDALNAAIALPEKQVAHNGQQVTYRSIAELIAARDALVSQKKAEEAATAGASPSRITYLYQANRGY